MKTKSRSKHLHVVKRRGHTEEYNDKKVYASVYSAALNCEYGEIKAEKIAKTITKEITSWIKNKKQVASNDIRLQITSYLKKIDEDVALMYRHHLDLS